MKRIAGIDIIKALAAFFVVSVHFLLNTKFYEMKLSGYGMIILTAARHFLLTCVPLFLIATGYLNRNKEPNKNYYKGIIKILISYIFICILCIIFRKFYFGEEKRMLSWIASIFNFSSNGYSWYIEMYIGLFLIIPYLNILYKSLETKKQKNGLMFTIIGLTSLPLLLNGIKILGHRLFVLPDWWINIYPITYYLIGCYIAEYKPKLSTKKNVLYILLVTLIHTIVYWMINEGGRFYKPFLGQYQNILTLILSVLIFILFYEKDLKNEKIKKITNLISTCSLDIYLFSYIVDLKIYSIIKPSLNSPKDHVLFMIPTVILVFITSLTLAYIKKVVFDMIEQSKNKDPKTKEYIKKTIEIIKNIGIYLLIFLTTLISLSSICTLLKINIIQYQVYISMILSIITLYLLNKKEKITKVLISVIISIILIIGSTIITQNYYDISWDGNSYHKDAVGLLKNGWNPIYDNYIDYYEKLDNRNMDFIGDKVELTHGFWQTYYPKATWHIGASFYAITNNIESGKVYNIIGILITFTLVLNLIFKLTNKFCASTIIALLLSINPISVVQCFNYYNDGFMGNLLMTLIFYMTLLALDKKETNKKELYTILSCLLLILINIKFTGFGYAGIFCLPYFLIFAYKKLKEKNIKELVISSTIFASTVIFSVCLVGYSPYITNLKEGLPIFYPLMGENKVDIVTHNQTILFNDKSTIYKFVKSMLSEVANMNQESGLKPQTKIPFTKNEIELELLNAPDLRISGFGPLFSGIFIISIVIIIIYIIKGLLKKNKYITYVIVPMLTSMILVMCISESWWARYSQYIYLVPITALILSTLDKSKIKYIFITIISIPLILNISYFIERNTIYNFQRSKVIEARLNELANKEIIVIDTKNEFVGMLYNFEDKNINFITTTEDSHDKKDLYMWNKYITKGEQ